MSEKKIKECRILEQQKIGQDVYSLWLDAGTIAENAAPGQFVSLYTKDTSSLLPRPISICEVDKQKKTLRLVYRVVGKGTEEFSKLKAGESIKTLGPLGNGFPQKDKKAFLIGGGIGIPPMLELAKSLDCEKQIILGYRDEVFMDKDFQEHGHVYIATEDGSSGTKGNVLDVIKEQGLNADVIYACGPTPMLRAIKAFALENGIECWLSLEEHMACGIGACLACVCQTKEKDSHTNVNNKRICKEGPVFQAEEVEI